MSYASPDHVQTQVDNVSAVAALDRKELVDLWTRAHGGPSPRGISRRLLQHAAAYHLQVKTSGGLSAASKRALHKVALTDQEAVPARKYGSKPAPKKLAPGTQLIREWHGRNHSVHVTDQGFFYSAKTYPSLSAVARAITGARWSGPRFFGL